MSKKTDMDLITQFLDENSKAWKIDYSFDCGPEMILTMGGYEDNGCNDVTLEIFKKNNKEEILTISFYKENLESIFFEKNNNELGIELFSEILGYFDEAIRGEE